MLRRAFLLALGATFLLVTPAAPQQSSIEVQATIDEGRLQVQSPILTVDSERLFADSKLGQRVTAELEAAGAELQASNNQIAAELEAEELELTRKRAELPSEEFRVLADAFDEKAQRIRNERANELRLLNQKLEDEQRAFLLTVGPILDGIMREAGAAVVLERRDVFIASRAVDITSLAISRIDAATEGTGPSND